MRERRPSPQTLLILQALLNRADHWQYGYDLTKHLGLKTGTLYPVLMRLADKGLLESEWHPSRRPGAPPRHAYRLTRSGVAYAREHVVGMAQSTGTNPMLPA